MSEKARIEDRLNRLVGCTGNWSVFTVILYIAESLDVSFDQVCRVTKDWAKARNIAFDNL